MWQLYRKSLPGETFGSGRKTYVQLGYATSNRSELARWLKIHKEKLESGHYIIFKLVPQEVSYEITLKDADIKEKLNVANN